MVESQIKKEKRMSGGKTGSKLHEIAFGVGIRGVSEEHKKFFLQYRTPLKIINQPF